jgi:hypothetical protein
MKKETTPANNHDVKIRNDTIFPGTQEHEELGDLTILFDSLLCLKA